MSDTDVMIIGAGMAGLSAARDLSSAGLCVTVLEAAQRVGGRILTDRTLASLPVELGAEFIHTEGAQTLAVARQAGIELAFLDPSSGYVLDLGSGDAGDPGSERTSLDLGGILAGIEQFEGPDQSAFEFLVSLGLRGPARTLAEMMLTAHPLGDLHELSMAGLRDDRVVELELGVDHRLAGGYDLLVNYMAGGLDIRLGWQVTKLRWSSSEVVATNSFGDQMVAKSAICTLPVGVLKAGALTFEPELPSGKWRALAHLEMGPAVKLIYRFTEPFWPESLTMLGCDGPVRLWWTPFYGRRDAPAVLTAYVTGHRARALSSMPASDAAEVGLQDLCRLFPDAHPEDLLASWLRMDWITEALARGAYSFVGLGGAGSRHSLAAADTQALFWAGDATATSTIASVVHGAFASGQRAAAEVLDFLSG